MNQPALWYEHPRLKDNFSNLGSRAMKPKAKMWLCYLNCSSVSLAYFHGKQTSTVVCRVTRFPSTMDRVQDSGTPRSPGVRGGLSHRGRVSAFRDVCTMVQSPNRAALRVPPCCEAACNRDHGSSNGLPRLCPHRVHSVCQSFAGTFPLVTHNNPGRRAPEPSYVDGHLGSGGADTLGPSHGLSKPRFEPLHSVAF